MTAPAAGHQRTTVAVGYDGSEAAQDAVRWAAEYAAAGNYRIRVVHAWVWPMFTKKLGPVRGVEGSGLGTPPRRSSRRVLTWHALPSPPPEPPAPAAGVSRERGPGNRCRRRRCHGNRAPGAGAARCGP